MSVFRRDNPEWVGGIPDGEKLREARQRRLEEKQKKLSGPGRVIYDSQRGFGAIPPNLAASVDQSVARNTKWLDSGRWKCSCGGRHRSYVQQCSCGLPNHEKARGLDQLSVHHRNPKPAQVLKNEFRSSPLPSPPARSSLTREQKAICDAVRDNGDRGSLKVHAFAGTGKTSTLVAIANACPNRQFLYIAFNKAAQEEATRKMPRNASARTAHSLAFAAVGRTYSDRLTTDRWPWLSYLREQRPEILRSIGAGGRDEFSCGALIQKTLERYLRTTDVSIGPEHAPSWCGQGLASLVASAAGALWEEVRKMNSRAPVTHDSYLKQFFLGGGQLTRTTRTVLLDEAQDADPVILALVQRHQGARVLVGDAYQQLYQWRGAINALRQAAADAILPLTQTFRFGADAASLANDVLGALGEARRIVAASHATTVSVGGDSRQVELVLARSNAGVLDEAVRFLDRRLRVHVMGGVDALIRLIEDAWALRKGRPARGELSIFTNWQEFRRAAFGDSDLGIPPEPGYAMLVRLIEDRGGQVMRMRDRLRGCVGAPEKAHVTISTVHKAKGLERHRVRVAGDLNQFFHPGKHGPEVLFEEGCVIYVGITRARIHLSIHPDTMEALLSSVEVLRKKNDEPANMATAAQRAP